MKSILRAGLYGLGVALPVSVCVNVAYFFKDRALTRALVEEAAQNDSARGDLSLARGEIKLLHKQLASDREKVAAFGDLANIAFSTAENFKLYANTTGAKIHDLESTLATQQQTINRTAELNHRPDVERERVRIRQAAAAEKQQIELKEEAKTPGLRQAKKEASASVDNYFRTHWQTGNEPIVITDVLVNISEMAPLHGMPGQWQLTGDAHIAYYISSASSFSSNTQKFSAVLTEKNPDSSIAVNLR